jgi:hypothetical protein
MKNSNMHLKKLFIPGQHNNFKPSFFSNKNSLIFSLFIFALFIFSMNIQTVVLGLSKYSNLAAILSTSLIEMTNQERSNIALNTLTENELLNQAAQLKAEDMASKGYFAHTSPEGKRPHHWLQDVGYKYQYAGENLAVNFATSKDVTVAWMNSPTHKANIIKPVYKDIGIGIAEGIYNKQKAIFVAQVFASPQITSTASIGDTTEVVTGPLYKFFEYLVTHNHDVLNKILITLLVFVICALVLKIVIHIKIQHGVLIVNALLVIGFISLLLLINNFMRMSDIPAIDYSTYEYDNTQE